MQIRLTLKDGGRTLAELQPLADVISARLDGEIAVTLVELDIIPRTRDGKHRVLIRAPREFT